MILKYKVCIIGPSPDVAYMGGVATHVKNLKSISCFHDAVVLDPGSSGTCCRNGFLSIIASILSIGRRLRIEDFSHILINASIYKYSFIKFLLIASIVPKREKQIVHAFFHGGVFSFLNSFTAFFFRLFFGNALAKIKCFYFLSSAQRDAFVKFFPGYSSNIYANYSTSDDTLLKLHTGDDAVLRLLFVGRIVKEKGIFELFSAFKELIRRNEKVHLVIAGDGPDFATLAKLSEELPSESIQFLGFVTGPELEMTYRKADLLVFPTYHEGFPYVAIEAMRAGLPIISTSSGALDDLVINGVTGFKVPVQDIDALIDRITFVNSNKDLLLEMSYNCHKYFKSSLNKSAAEIFYRKLLEGEICD